MVQPLLVWVGLIGGLSVMGMVGSGIGASKEWALGGVIAEYGTAGMLVALLVVWSWG